VERPAGSAPAITEWHSALVTFRMSRVVRAAGVEPALHGLEDRPTTTIFRPRYPEPIARIERAWGPYKGAVVAMTDRLAIGFTLQTCSRAEFPDQLWCTALERRLPKVAKLQRRSSGSN
jgi:hypothetical protein